MMTENYDFDNTPQRIGTRSVKWDEAAADVLPLWVADMDFATAPCVQRAIAQRALHPCFGYTLVPEEYYQAIIRWFGERHGWDIKREEILYTIGVVPAIAAILRAVCQTGDHVVMLTPAYNCFYSCIRNAGAVASESRMIDDERLTINDEGLMIGDLRGTMDDASSSVETLEPSAAIEPLEPNFLRYAIDWEDLEERLANERATVMLLCNPHNPVGRIWTREELARIASLCKRYNVLMISDEIHNELTRPGTSYVPLATTLDERHRGLKYAVCTSPSKAFNIAGLQNANIMVPDAELRRKIDRAINLNETCDVNPFGVEAVIAAYNEGAEWLEALRQYIWKNYAFAVDYLTKEIPGLRIAEMQATYLMWVDYSQVCQMPSAVMRKRLVEEARVWMAEGTTYGEAGEYCLRVNLATSRKILEEALSRLTRWVKTNC